MWRSRASDKRILLDAIESNPTNDSGWLAFADWSEKRGDSFDRLVEGEGSISRSLREALETRRWIRCQHQLAWGIDPAFRLLWRCHCAERVIPLYESRYPGDARPRRLIQAVEQLAGQRRRKSASDAAAEACQAARVDALRDPERFLAAWSAARVAYRLGLGDRGLCTNAALTQVIGAFGPQVHFTDPKSNEFQPEWRLALEAEFRWQVARLLSYY
jgi:uncharacterized protein (TIGR02996 family)